MRKFSVCFLLGMIFLIGMASATCATTTCSDATYSPSGIVIAVFSIIFISLFFFLVYFLINMIAHMLALDYDAIDAAWVIGSYFAMCAFSMLQETYLGNVQMQNFLDTFISIGIWTNLFLPIIGIFIVLAVKPFVEKKRAKAQEYE